MSTAAQIAANQANAQHSTGAKTEAGKAASATNNRKYGLTGAFFILPSEDQDDFRKLCSDLTAEHKPSTITEGLLITKMAQHYWMSQRALSLQNYCFYGEMDATTPPALNLFMRYQTTHDRAFHKCLDQLVKLRAEKRKEQIGFESQKHRQAAQEAGDARKQAEETRRQEAHQAKTRLQNAKAEYQELDTEIKATIEAVLPGHTRIPLEDLKSVLRTSIHGVLEEKERVAAQKAA